MPGFFAGHERRIPFRPCGLAAFFSRFTGITPRQVKDFVAAGASDDEVANWIRSNSKEKEPLAVIPWNNEMKCKRIGDLPDSYQEYFEEYVPTFCPQPDKVRFFFDVYDAEERRL